MGDRALVEIAAVLKVQSRADDLVSRFGGEEFAVALPGAESADARVYTERVATALGLIDIADGLTLSTSAGISSLTTEGESAGTLLQRADDALYAAKDGGRARQAWWDGGIVVGAPFGQKVSAPVVGAGNGVVTRSSRGARGRSRFVAPLPERPAVVEEHVGGPVG